MDAELATVLEDGAAACHKCGEDAGGDSDADGRSGISFALLAEVAGDQNYADGGPCLMRQCEVKPTALAAIIATMLNAPLKAGALVHRMMENPQHEDEVILNFIEDAVTAVQESSHANVDIPCFRAGIGMGPEQREDVVEAEEIFPANFLPETLYSESEDIIYPRRPRG